MGKPKKKKESDFKKEPNFKKAELIITIISLITVFCEIIKVFVEK